MYFLWTLALLLLVSYLSLKKRYNYWKNRNVPFEKPLPIVGNLYDVVRKKQHLFEKVRSIYNNFSSPYVGIFLLHKPAVLIRSPELIKTILIKDFNKFINRGLAVNFDADPLAFYTLFFMKDDAWREMRSKVSAAFTPSQMRSMHHLMQEHVDKIVSYLKERNKETLEFKTLMRRFSTDITAACIIGVTTDCLTNEKSEFFQKTERLIDTANFIRRISMFSYFFMHKVVGIFKLTFADTAVTDYLSDVFKKSVEEKRKQQKVVRHDFVDWLLISTKKESLVEGNRQNDKTAMLSQVLTFFGAAVETFGIILAFALQELAKNETIQNRLRKSVQTAMKDGELSYETVQSVKYLDMVVNETLRKYPLAGILIRTVHENYEIEETKLVLEKDIPVIIPVSGLHYDPEYYPDPDKFDPERFNDENIKTIPQLAFLPFGDGPRYCIGQNLAVAVIKLTIANVIKNFAFSTTMKMEDKEEGFDPDSTQFVQSKSKICLKVHNVG